MTSTGRFTLRQRVRYRFDNALSRGLWAVLAWLGVLAVLFAVIIAAIIRLTGIGPGDSSTSFGDGLWHAVTRALDPGTVSGDEGAGFRWLMMLVTIVGIFLAAAIIGLVSSSIDTRIDELRRGKSLVVESGHTLIIGRSDKLTAVVAEIVEANRSESHQAIVVFTPDDGVEVSDEIRASVPDMATTRLVVRSGIPTRTSDLARANPQTARSAIVLRGVGESDAHVVKAVLALSRLVPDLDGIVVVAEIEDEGTADALRSAVGPNLITVVPNPTVARLTAQVSRAAGLGPVYQELLDFAGDEFYLVAVPQAWIGRNFGELLLASTTATIVGLRHPDSGVTLNPDPRTVLEAGHEAIGICEDDSLFRFDAAPVPWQPADERRWVPLDPSVEKTLIVGWSNLGPLVCTEIDRRVAAGSTLRILADPDLHDLGAIRASMRLSHQQAIVQPGVSTYRDDVIAALDQGPYDHIMVLCERENFDIDEADARTLLSMMLIRAQLGNDVETESIVAEVLDPHDVELGGTDDTSDFIVSQKLVSLLMAQLSQSPHLEGVFRDLFDSEGIVLALHPAERYVDKGSATFADVIRNCREWSVVPMGYRKQVPGGSYEVRLNPSKSEQLNFVDGDSIVVLAPLT